PELAGYSPITGRGLVPKRRLRKAMAAYYALITHLDHQIGRFLQSLNEYGELHNTVILFTSDHGELLGDHHLFRKSLPYEGSTHVPFIVNDPGNRLGLKRGAVSDSVVELRDIMPSLLEAAGVPVPETVEGKSIWKLALAENEGEIDPAWRQHLHGEHAQGAQSHHWVTDGKEKYIWFSQIGEEQFFDLVHDPKELHNAIADEGCQERIRHWRVVLMQELDGREEGYTDGERLITGKKPITVLSHIHGIAQI
ncbi:sulfatase-like hydrolase/transferase, partial [Paenibacillus glucanolyticus]